MRKVAGGILGAIGFLLFLFGLYMFPAGADAFYWFMVEVIAGGDWTLGMALVYLVCLLFVHIGGYLYRPDIFNIIFTNPLYTLAYALMLLVLGLYLGSVAYDGYFRDTSQMLINMGGHW